MFDKRALEFARGFIPEGYQVKRARRPSKSSPEWLFSDKEFFARVCKDYQRRYRIGYLYWRLGWTAREVAEETGENISAVKSIIYRIKKL